MGPVTQRTILSVAVALVIGLAAAVFFPVPAMWLGVAAIVVLGLIAVHAAIQMDREGLQ